MHWANSLSYVSNYQIKCSRSFRLILLSFCTFDVYFHFSLSFSFDSAFFLSPLSVHFNVPKPLSGNECRKKMAASHCIKVAQVYLDRKSLQIKPCPNQIKQDNLHIDSCQMAECFSKFHLTDVRQCLFTKISLPYKIAAEMPNKSIQIH